ncbi:MAG TPA: glycosyltransferase [Longimicrobiales bacterium]
MKLLLLTRSLNEGGAERQLVTLARALADLGRPPVVAVFYKGGVLENELTRAGVSLRNLGKRGRWDLATFAARAAALARSEKPDVVYSMLPTANLVASGLKVVARDVRVVWGIRASQVNASDYDALNAWTLRLQRALSPSADGIIVNSHAGKRDLVNEGYREDRITVVLNGIDVDVFARTAAGRESVRREWQVADDDTLVGIVARFDPMKDHRTFFDAAAIVAGQCPHIKFVCVGTGAPGLVAAARKAAQEAGIADRLIWAGARPDMPAVYSALDMCVLSSAYGEGFPNVLGEAMACGTPCVATTVGDAELIVSGWGGIAPPRDPRQLAAAILAVAAETHSDSWREAARAHICDRFSVSTMLQGTEQVLWQNV